MDIDKTLTTMILLKNDEGAEPDWLPLLSPDQIAYI